ncbi:MAG: hypothetical protein HYR60_21530 [Acidobacteria bacterium]|nr:hypothetical protein [Acidobacteriota bacterium]
MRAQERGVEGRRISRRLFLAAPAAAAGFSAPPLPMVPWIFLQSPIERWMADYRRTFDAWAEGGVRGIAIGYMRFAQSDGASIPAFAADPRIYRGFGVDPPAAQPRDPAKEKRLQAMLDDAAARGWEILLFGLGRTGGSRPLAGDPFDSIGFAASAQDAMNAYPQAHGVILDGPGEHHYELAFHHGGELFEIREAEKPRLAVLGYDVGRMERGIAHLRARFHHLTPSMVRFHSPGGFLGGLALFDLNEDALYWLRTRQETSLGYLAAVRRRIDQLNRKVKLGGIPRAPAFSVLTSQDYLRIHPYFDYLLPKHYFWHRGFDGMYGTVARWVAKIHEWNPGLTEPDCFAVVKSWFGIDLPGIHTLQDLEMGFPDEFFARLVYAETRRALDAVNDDSKVIAWVSTGRRPHAGDPMPAQDLYRILVSSQQAGLKRFLFHPDPDLGVAEWSVISGLCGKRWKETPGGYWPPDTPRPDSFNGGRRPPVAQ